MKFVYPKENTKTYNYYKKLIDKAVSQIGVDDLFNIKFLVTIVVLSLILLIAKSNVYYQATDVVEDIKDSSVMLYSTDKKDEDANKKEVMEKKKKEREIFYKLKNNFSISELKKNEAGAVNRIAMFLYTNNIKTKDEQVEDIARRMFDKLKKYDDAQNIDYFGILLMVIIAFFTPEGFLYIRSFLVKYFIYNEFLQLEVTAIMVGKLEPIKVEEILNVLSENSKYFKKYIDEIRYNYFDVKNGHSKAFDSVIARISHKELRYLMKSLQQAAESDLKITIENLENQRKSNKEFRNIREQNKLKQKDLLGIMIILGALAAVCVYAFAPFELIMNDFNI